MDEYKVSPDYILFVVKYCISHNTNLRFPKGIKYFVINKKIRESYMSDKRVDIYSFKAVPRKKDDGSKYAVNSNSGFSKILGR